MSDLMICPSANKCDSECKHRKAHERNSQCKWSGNMCLECITLEAHNECYESKEVNIHEAI